MNETLVAKALASMIAAVTALDNGSARVTESNGNAHMATGKKSKRIEPIAITLTQAMVDGRMKLPARAFTKGTKVDIDGHIITQQEADQGRSTKFDPEIFGLDANVGDVLVFSHEGGRAWSVEIERQRGRKATTSAKPARAEKPTSSKKGKTSSKRGTSKRVTRNDDDDDDEDEAPSRAKTTASNGNGRAPMNVKKGIAHFANIAIDNADDDDFEQNENIKATGVFKTDARVYFNTKQSQQFRSWRKKMGLTLKKAVSLLNAEVYEDWNGEM
jgi:hypothetical protein